MNKNVPFFFEDEGGVCSGRRMTAGDVNEHRWVPDCSTVSVYGTLVTIKEAVL